MLYPALLFEAVPSCFEGSDNLTERVHRGGYWISHCVFHLYEGEVNPRKHPEVLVPSLPSHPGYGPAMQLCAFICLECNKFQQLRFGDHFV